MQGSRSASSCAGLSIQLCKAPSSCIGLSTSPHRAQHQSEQHPYVQRLSIQMCWIHYAAVRGSLCLCKTQHQPMHISEAGLATYRCADLSIQESHPAVRGSPSLCRTDHQPSTAQHPAMQHPAVHSIQLCRAQNRAALTPSWSCSGTGLDIPSKAGVQGEAETIHSRRLTAGTGPRERAGKVLAELKRFITEISSG